MKKSPISKIERIDFILVISLFPTEKLENLWIKQSRVALFPSLYNIIYQKEILWLLSESDWSYREIPHEQRKRKESEIPKITSFHINPRLFTGNFMDDYPTIAIISKMFSSDFSNANVKLREIRQRLWGKDFRFTLKIYRPRMNKAC